MLEFKAGDPLQYKSEAHHTEAEEPVERSKTFYLDTKPPSTSGRKLLIALGAIAGIVIVIWGGYVLYNRNGTSSTPMVADSATVLSSDTMAISSMPDSFQRASTDSTASRSTYKFVIERTANKARALRRYNQLQEHLADVQLETQDSSLFKLYFLLPATPADTARIRDSLKSWYGRRFVYVE